MSVLPLARRHRPRPLAAHEGQAPGEQWLSLLARRLAAGVGGSDICVTRGPPTTLPTAYHLVSPMKTELPPSTPVPPRSQTAVTAPLRGIRQGTGTPARRSPQAGGAQTAVAGPDAAPDADTLTRAATANPPGGGFSGRAAAPSLGAGAALAAPTIKRAATAAPGPGVADDFALWPAGAKDKQRDAPLDNLSPAQQARFWGRLEKVLTTKALAYIKMCMALPRGAHNALRAMELKTAHSRYATVNTTVMGGFGKVRPGRRLDGLDVAIKIAVLPRAVAEDLAAAQATGRRRKEFKTAVTRPEDLARELAIMRLTKARCQPLDIAVLDDWGKVALVLPAMSASLAGRPISAATARNMMAQVLVDVRNCHAAGYLHRDIKPDNLLYSTDGRIMLHDYGLATAFTEAGVGAGDGTARYMAPEALRGENCGPASDIWSLGLTYAEMLAGTPNPFAQGGDFVGMIRVMPAFARWQEALRRPDGSLDIAALRARAAAAASSESTTPESEFDAFFGAMLDRDARLGAYVLDRMLNFDPARRPAAAAVEAVVADAGDREADAAIARAELQERGRRTGAAAARRAVIEAYRQAMLVPPGP